MTSRRRDAGLLAGITLTLFCLPGATTAQTPPPHQAFAQYCRYVGEARNFTVKCAEVVNRDNQFIWTDELGPSISGIDPGGASFFLVNVAEVDLRALCVTREAADRAATIIADGGND